MRRARRYRRPDGSVVELHPGDTLTGGDVLPGFAVADLFRPAAAAAAEPA